MIEAIAALVGHLSDIIAEIGSRLSYSYSEIAENQLLGGADVQKYLLCMRWDWEGSWETETTWGERWWVDVYGGDLATYYAFYVDKPPTWLGCPAACPGPVPGCQSSDLMPLVTGNLGAGAVIGNLIGFPFMWDAGKLIVDIGNIIEQLAEALKALG